LKTPAGKDKTEHINLPQNNAGNNITARESLLTPDDINNYKADEHKEAAVYNNVTDTGIIDADSKLDRTGKDFKRHGKKKKKKDKKHITKEDTGQSNTQIENCTDHLRNADVTKADHVDTNVNYRLSSQVKHDEHQEQSTSKHKDKSEEKNVKNGDLWNKKEYNNIPQPNAGNNILAHNKYEIANNINDTGKMDLNSKRDRTGDDSKKRGKKKKKKDKKHNKKEAADQSMVQTENSTDHLRNADIQTDRADANDINQLNSQADNDNRQEGSKIKHMKTLEGNTIENSAHLNKVDYSNVSQPNAGNNIPAQERVVRIDVIHDLAHNEFKETELANNVGYTVTTDLDGDCNGLREYSERHGKKKKRQKTKYSEIEATGQSIVQEKNITDHLRNTEITRTDIVDIITINQFCSQAEHEKRQEGSTSKHKKKIRIHKNSHKEDAVEQIENI
ncbi:hypothetical protein ACJMK2_012275, partial [Sinanodonta woodiana]